jgi:hypothetical protein
MYMVHTGGDGGSGRLRLVVQGLSVEFIGVDEAIRHVHREHASYIARVERSEENRRVRTFGSARTFAAAVREWTPALVERVTLALHFAVRCVRRGSEARRWLPLLRRGPAWRLMLVDETLEGGMPHTIADAIVVAEPTVRSLRFPGTLVHERIHVLQKAYPAWFARLYTRWGWAAVEDPRKLPAAIARYHRLNPDTPVHWQWRLPASKRGAPTPATQRSRPIVPWMSLREAPSMHDARPMAFAIDNRGTGDATGGGPLSEVRAYAEYFRCDARHCYHPDENAAVIITELMGGAKRSALASSSAALAVVQWRTYDAGPLRL